MDGLVVLFGVVCPCALVLAVIGCRGCQSTVPRQPRPVVSHVRLALTAEHLDRGGLVKSSHAHDSTPRPIMRQRRVNTGLPSLHLVLAVVRMRRRRMQHGTVYVWTLSWWSWSGEPRGLGFGTCRYRRSSCYR